MINYFQDILDTLPADLNEVENPLQLIEIIKEKVEMVIEALGGSDKYLDILNEIQVDKVNIKLLYHVTYYTYSKII